MTVARYVVTGLLVALLVFSACQKLSGRPAVVESYARVGVDRRRLPLLAAVLLAGATGLVTGFVWTPIGVAAATALVAYFALALVAHAVHDDLVNAVPPTVLLVLAAGAAVLFGIAL